MVPQASAIVPETPDAESIAIPANHINMVKYASREDPGYEKISEHLQLMVKEASAAISERWVVEDRIGEGRMPSYPPIHVGG